MSNKEPRFMRFVVRPGCKGGIVGFNIGLFEEGAVYEVREVFDGEMSIKKVGTSPLSLPLGRLRGEEFGFNNGLDYNALYTQHGGNIVRTIDEHQASAVERQRSAGKQLLDLAPCASVRVDFGDETSWGEYVGDGVFMSTNQTLSSVPLKVPEGHAQFANNGKTANMKWGHLFVGEAVRALVIRPTFIVGHFDEVRCTLHQDNVDTGECCHRCRRYITLVRDPFRTDAEDRQMVDLHLWLKELGKDPGLEPVARRERGPDDSTVVPT